MYWRVKSLSQEGFTVYPVNPKITTYITPQKDRALLDELPVHFIGLLLLHEDSLFFQHRGFNFPEIALAFKDVITGKSFRGGSSISQQLVDYLFYRRIPRQFKLKFNYRYKYKIIKRKCFDIIHTVLLERQKSKSEILSLYVNYIRFGYFGQGIYQAAAHCLNKRAQDLSIAESCILIALLPGKYYRNKAFKYFTWQKQVFDFDLSYTKITHYLRWIHVVESKFNKNITTSYLFKFYHENLKSFTGACPALPDSLEEEIQVQATQHVEEISKLLAKIRFNRANSFHSSFSGAPLLLLSLLNESITKRSFQYLPHLIKNSTPEDLTLFHDLIRKHYAASAVYNAPSFSLLPQLTQLEIKRKTEIEAALLMRQILGFLEIRKYILAIDCKFILVKGLDLQHRLYQPNDRRPGFDIDIIISDKSYLSLAKILEMNGYHRIKNVEDKLLMPVSIKSGEAISWKNKGLDLTIDIHIYQDIRFESLYKRSNPQKNITLLPSVTYQSLSDEELFKYLCRHGKRHGWGRLTWLDDIRRIVDKIPPDELKSIISTQEQQEKNIDFLLPLFLITRLFSVNYPCLNPFFHQKYNQLYALHNLLIPIIFSSKKNNIKGLTKIKVLFFHELTYRGALKSVFDYLCRPTANDISHIKLEPKNAWLYIIYRPARVFMRMFFSK
jgi:hypothetical protein